MESQGGDDQQEDDGEGEHQVLVDDRPGLPAQGQGEDDVLDDVVEAWVWVLEKRREEREVSFFSPNEKRNQKRFFPFSTPKLSSLFFASFSPSNNSPGQRPPQVTMAAVVVAGSA